jgi:predicted RNase H-like nuclease (RuvC/YqgF family)
MPQEDVVPRPDSPESLSSRSEAVPAPSLKTRPHWKDLLTELQKQINGLDQDLAAKKEQWAKGQEENEKLKKSVENLENHIQNLQTELGKRAEELEKTIEALTAARTAVAQVTRRAEVMDAKIAELKQKHQEEIGILNSRIETEATHRLEGFKHSVARVLRVDYADFKINAGKPMTVELGQGLHHLLASIFDGLQKSGINAKD